MEIIKICVTCKENKPLSEYYVNKNKRKDGSIRTYHRNECKACTIKRSSKWGNDNRDRKREHWRKYSKYPYKRKMQAEISRKVRESGKYLEWQRSNKDKLLTYRLNRSHKTHDISESEWVSCKEYFDNSCAYCGLHESEHYVTYRQELKLTDLHKDHVEHEGSNDIKNCVPACKVCNSSKHIFKLEDWYNKDNPIYTEERLVRIYKWIQEDVHKIKK